MNKSALQNDDLLQSYFEQIKKIPLLNFEEELELSKRIQRGDEAACQKLVTSNLRLVIKIARSYITSDTSLMDLIQEGNLGLMRAAEKFSHLKNVRFATYAGWWIRQSIRRFLSTKRRTIRLPARKEETLNRVRQAYHTLTQTYMRAPTTKELSDEIGVPLTDLEFIMQIDSGMLSLDMEGEEDSASIGDFQEDYTFSPERDFMKKTTRADTLRFLDRLKDREKRILVYRFQLDGEARYSLKKISDKMGISPETVRQIEQRALRKIRPHAEELRKCVCT